MSSTANNKDNCSEDTKQRISNNASSVETSISLDPNAAWEKTVGCQIFLNPLKSTTKKPQDCTRLVCISDTHGRHSDIHLPHGDVLLHGGDFTRCGEIECIQSLSAYFRDSAFNEVICIAGNHDMSLHESFYKGSWSSFHLQPLDCNEARTALKHCVYLEDSSCTTKSGRGDIEVYGSPWSPEFFNWAFNLPRGSPLRDVWDKIPDSTDILMTHGPPLGRGDLTDRHGRAGCYDLLVAVQDRIRPRVHIFGHIHEGAGVSFDGHTLYVNASSLNIAYRPVHYPVVIDLPKDPSKPAMVVPPDCRLRATDLLEWLEKKNFKLVANFLRDSSCNFEDLPSGNDFFEEFAFQTICDKLLLHQSRDASRQLSTALSNLYVESFPR